MMLDTIGDTLNWLIAGIAFPLMFLPLAMTLGGTRKSFPAWLTLVITSVCAGVLFAWLAPILSVTPSASTAMIFAGILAGLSLIVFFSGGASPITERITPIFEVIVRGVAKLVMWLLIFMALIQFGIVVLRYVFGLNYIFMQESITYMHGTVFLLAGGYALLTDDHVRVDIFYSQASHKRKALIDLLGTYLLLFPVCLILLWTASPYVANSWAVTEGSQETSGIQAVFLLKSLIPAFAILLVMSGFNIAARASATLRGGA